MKPRRSYVDGHYGQIHIQSLGSGPAILLNHQSASSSNAFEAVYAEFADAGFTAIGIDSPGMGNSDAPPDKRWSLDMFAVAGATVIDALNLGPVIVAGHHTGAGTTLRHAMLYPDQVRGIVLHQLIMLEADMRDYFAANPIPPIHAQRDGTHLTAGWNARIVAADDWTMVEPMNRGVLDLLRSSPLVARSFAAALGYDPEPDVRTVACPVLILTNTGDRNHVHALKARKLRPDFAYAELQGGAMDIMDEQPKQWAGTIIDFARSLPAN